MHCTVCLEPVGPNAAPFHCALCARTALYPTRVKLATTLLEAEKFSKHVEGIVAPSPATSGQALSLSGGLLLDVNESAKKAAYEHTTEAIAELRERAKSAEDAAVRLRERLRELKEVAKRGRGELDERKRVLRMAKEKLKERRERWLNGKDKVVTRMEKNWALLHTRTAQGRVDLCKEAADLAGLKYRKRRGADGGMRDEYIIGYNPAPNLKELNSLTPVQISASLVNTARLLVLISNYLNVRLPAEVTLPQKNYPQPTIFHPSASYTKWDPTFPGGGHSSNSSSTYGRTNSNKDGNGDNSNRDSTTATAFAPKAAVERRARPRPLYADRRLPALAREEPAIYTLFVEGVTLLAWDVAWLCHVQGMVTSFATWEDLCPLGRNLHELLVVRLRDSLSTLNKNHSATADAASSNPTSQAQTQSASPLSSFGQFSHGTARCFLGAAEGQSRMRSWKWQSQFRLLLDKVKTNLAAEMQGAEWEMLESKEWFEAPGKVDEEPIVVGRGMRGSTVMGSTLNARITERAEKGRNKDNVNNVTAKATLVDGIRPPLPGNMATTTAVHAVSSRNTNANTITANKIIDNGSTNATPKSDSSRIRAPSFSTRKGSEVVDISGSNGITTEEHASASPLSHTPARRNSESRGVNGWTKLKSRSGEPT